MAYSGVSDPSLPKNVQKLSAVRKRQWLAAFDSAKKRNMPDGDAIHLANGVVKKQMGHSMAQGKHETDSDLLTDIGFMIESDTEEMLSEVGQQCGYDSYAPSSYVPKISKADAAYDPFGAAGGQGCATCRWYLNGQDSCYVVEGYGDIYPGGLSNRYEAVPVYEPSIPEIVLVDADGDPIDFADLFSELTAGGMSLEKLLVGVSSKEDFDSLSSSDKLSVYYGLVDMGIIES